MSRSDTSRRGLMIGGAAGLALTGAVLGLRRSDQGQGHDRYFTQLAQRLDREGVGRPVLLVDQARMMANADAALSTLSAQALPVRLVVKSLPALGLLDPLAARLKTQRFMVFNGPMLDTLAAARPGADILMGKPLTAIEAAPRIAAARHNAAPAAQRPVWLIDTMARLQDYIALAQTHQAPLAVSFEIDVGLHRGGFATPDALAEAVRLAASTPLVTVAGLMGYDPHVAKVPNPAKAFAKSQAAYGAAIDVLKHLMGADFGTMVLNAAGSPTYRLHGASTVANEVSIGSGFVKPTDFDIENLSHHVPAAFIATPVLKVLDQTQVPALEALSGVMAGLNPNLARAYFIHGGHWMAQPVSPAGLHYNDLYGRSSNQEMLNGSVRTGLKVGDWVFLRPTQSEALFLQFGPIGLYDKDGPIVWTETFPVSA